MAAAAVARSAIVGTFGCAARMKSGPVSPPPHGGRRRGEAPPRGACPARRPATNAPRTFEHDRSPAVNRRPRRVAEPNVGVSASSRRHRRRRRRRIASRIRLDSRDHVPSCGHRVHRRVIVAIVVVVVAAVVVTAGAAAGMTWDPVPVAPHVFYVRRRRTDVDRKSSPKTNKIFLQFPRFAFFPVVFSTGKFADAIIFSRK